MNVTITVNYGYDIHSVNMASSTFDRIRKGASLVKKGRGFHLDGRFDQDYWRFNVGYPGSIDVSTEGGGQVYVGSFLDAEVWISVDGKDVNFEWLDPVKGGSALDGLVKAYRQAEYRVPSENIVLRIGERSLELLRLQARHGYSFSSFITAANPFSEHLTEQQNEERNRELALHVHKDGLPLFQGEGVGDGGWREPSFLVLGLTLKKANELALQFRQLGFVFADIGGVPLLRLTKRDSSR